MVEWAEPVHSTALSHFFFCCRSASLLNILIQTSWGMQVYFCVNAIRILALVPLADALWLFHSQFGACSSWIWHSCWHRSRRHSCVGFRHLLSAEESTHLSQVSHYLQHATAWPASNSLMWTTKPLKHGNPTRFKTLRAAPPPHHSFMSIAGLYRKPKLDILHFLCSCTSTRGFL